MVAHIFYGSITALVPGFPQKQEAIRQSCSYRDILFLPSEAQWYVKCIVCVRCTYFFHFCPLYFLEYLKYIDLVLKGEYILKRVTFASASNIFHISLFLGGFTEKRQMGSICSRNDFYTESECSYWGHIQCHYRWK